MAAASGLLRARRLLLLLLLLLLLALLLLLSGRLLLPGLLIAAPPIAGATALSIRAGGAISFGPAAAQILRSFLHALAKVLEVDLARFR